MNHNRYSNLEPVNVSYKIKPTIENKPSDNKLNHYKDYQDEHDSIVPRGSDSSQVRELKNKMKTVMVKLSTTKKQNQSLQKEKQSLNEEITNLQHNLRQMVSGFANTSSNFPINNQLAAKLAQFYKCDCLDLFFDLLCPAELSMKGVIFFYHQAFNQISKRIDLYLQPALQSLLVVGCFTTLEGPIMNVLRKAFQTTYKQIIQKISTPRQIELIASDIIYKLNIEGEIQTNNSIINFLKKLTQLLLCCKICDPPMHVDLDSIGKKVKYNALKNDLLDGFINPKDECWVVLPQIRRSDEKGDNFTKSVVLKVDYDLVN